MVGLQLVVLVELAGQDGRAHAVGVDAELQSLDGLAVQLHSDHCSSLQTTRYVVTMVSRGILPPLTISIGARKESSSLASLNNAAGVHGE